MGHKFIDAISTADIRALILPIDRAWLPGVASTVLYESGHFKEDWIEMQLAHVQRNKVKGAYNHAKYLKQRKFISWSKKPLSYRTAADIRMKLINGSDHSVIDL